MLSKVGETVSDLYVAITPLTLLALGLLIKGGILRNFTIIQSFRNKYLPLVLNNIWVYFENIMKNKHLILNQSGSKSVFLADWVQKPAPPLPPPKKQQRKVLK